MGMGTQGSLGGYGDTRLTGWVWGRGHKAHWVGMGTQGSLGGYGDTRLTGWIWGHQAHWVGMGTQGSLGGYGDTRLTGWVWGHKAHWWVWGHKAHWVGMGTQGSLGGYGDTRLTGGGREKFVIDFIAPRCCYSGVEQFYFDNWLQNRGYTVEICQNLLPVSAGEASDNVTSIGEHDLMLYSHAVAMAYGSLGHIRSFHSSGGGGWGDGGMGGGGGESFFLA